LTGLTITTLLLDYNRAFIFGQLRVPKSLNFTTSDLQTLLHQLTGHAEDSTLRSALIQV